MITAFFGVPIIFEQSHVEIKTLNRGLTVPNDFHGAFAETDRRKPWRTGETLLGAAIGDINTARIEIYGLPTEGGYAVCEKERTVFVGDFDGFC